ncbi:MAG: mechanosensitive ion channel family protein [Phycisphaerae bacterium]
MTNASNNTFGHACLRRILAMTTCAMAMLAGSSHAFSQQTSPEDQQPSQQTQAGNETPGQEQPGKEGKAGIVDLATPRATMRTFLLAVEESRREDPNRINDAVKTLDLTGIPADQRKERGPSIARRLYDVIDRIGVRLEDLPIDTGRDDYVFYRGEVPTTGAQIEGTEPMVSIGLDFDTEEWKFTPETIDSLRVLETQLKEAKADNGAVDDEIPMRFRSPRALMKAFIEAMNASPPNYTTAASCFDPGDFKEDIWQPKSRDLAVQLKTVMDKTRLVVLSEVPETVSGNEAYVWHTSESGSIEINRIEEGTLKGQWRFSQATTQSLERLYTSLQDKQIIPELREAGIKEQLTLALRIERAVPPSMRVKYFYLAVWQWLSLVALVAAGWMIRLIFSWLTRLAMYAVARAAEKIDKEAFHRALKWSGYAAAVYFWLLIIPRLGLPTGLLAFAMPLIKFFFAVSLTWFGYQVADFLALYVLRDEDVVLTEADDLLLPLLRAVMKTVVGVLVILFAMEWFFDQPPSTILGALGIGGVALAFAAKDTLGNFFGSLTLLFDRPFGIGDWIAIAGVEGTVEHVGFRSTRIRTFYNSKITIPNSVLATSNIDNFGARRYRRIKTNISVTYDTPPDKIEAFCEGVRELIRLHQYTRKDYYQVYFNNMSSSSLDILLYAFLETPDWSTELRERHNLLLDIVRLANRLGVEFAFPTQTLWVNQGGDGPMDSTATENADGGATMGVNSAAEIFGETYPEGRRGPAMIERTPRSQRKHSPPTKQ